MFPLIPILSLLRPRIHLRTLSEKVGVLYPEGYTSYHIPRETKRIYGKDVTFSGYLVVQEGMQLKPDELRGIMIRVKNIGIGYYDQGMLDYRVNQGPRSRWITGEIYVEQGLEDALNIDRDSFNRFHPEFRFIQDRVHEILSKKIFPFVYKNIEARSEKRERKKAKAQKRALRSVVGVRGERAARAAVTKAEEVDSELKIKKKYRELAYAIMSIYGSAEKESSPEKRRMAFTRLLLELLGRW